MNNVCCFTVEDIRPESMFKHYRKCKHKAKYTIDNKRYCTRHFNMIQNKKGRSK